MPDGVPAVGSAPARIVALRRLLLRNGYRPVPLYPHDAKVTSAGKRPIGTGWQKRAAAATEAAIAGWPDGNTGLLCGTLIGVDIDVPVPELADSLAALAQGIIALPTPLRRIGKAPKLLLCFRVAEPIAKIETPELFLPDGTKVQVEILADGQQFAAYGIHPDTGAEYTWPDSGPDAVPFADIPITTEGALRGFIARAEQLLRAAGAELKDRPKDDKPYNEAHPAEAAAPAAKSGRSDFFREVNRRALADCDRWVRRLFPAATWLGNAASPPGMWRVTSKDLGRPYQEDLSIHPARGVQDFGPRKGMTCIDLVMEFGGAPDAVKAAHTLCEWLGVAPEDCGWRSASAERRAGGAAAKRGTDTVWPEPVDFLGDSDLTGLPELRREHLPDALAAFAFDTAARMGADPACVALAAVVSAASVIHDDWCIQPKANDTTWTESPRLWGAIIGPPSIMKTPLIGAATKPIDALETQARREHAEAMRAWKIEVAAMKADKSQLPFPAQPRCDRYMVESVTVEALSEVLRDDDDARFRTPARKVLVRQDELSEWIAGLDQYRAGGRGGADRGAYLRAYNGGRFTIDRVGRGSFAVPNWSACILGGIQPEPIQRVAKDAADDGLLQRFLFVVPGAQSDGEDRMPDGDAIVRYRALFPALAVLRPPLYRLSGEGRPVVLSAGAQQQRQAVDLLLKAQRAMPDTSARLQAALTKLHATFVRLALVFHVVNIADAHARGEDAPVMDVLGEDTARRAAALLRDVLLPHLLRADALMFRTPQTGHARWIAGFILSRGLDRIAVRDVVRAYRELKAPEQRDTLLNVMDALVSVGWLHSDAAPGERPKSWAVNPSVHTVFAPRAAEERDRRDRAREEIAEAIRKVKGTA